MKSHELSLVTWIQFIKALNQWPILTQFPWTVPRTRSPLVHALHEGARLGVHLGRAPELVVEPPAPDARGDRLLVAGVEVGQLARPVLVVVKVRGGTHVFRSYSIMLKLCLGHMVLFAYVGMTYAIFELTNLVKMVNVRRKRSIFLCRDCLWRKLASNWFKSKFIVADNPWFNISLPIDILRLRRKFLLISTFLSPIFRKSMFLTDPIVQKSTHTLYFFSINMYLRRA